MPKDSGGSGGSDGSYESPKRKLSTTKHCELTPELAVFGLGNKGGAGHNRKRKKAKTSPHKSSKVFETLTEARAAAALGGHSTEVSNNLAPPKLKRLSPLSPRSTPTSGLGSYFDPDGKSTPLPPIDCVRTASDSPFAAADVAASPFAPAAAASASPSAFAFASDSSSAGAASDSPSSFVSAGADGADSSSGGADSSPMKRRRTWEAICALNEKHNIISKELRALQAVNFRQEIRTVFQLNTPKSLINGIKGSLKAAFAFAVGGLFTVSGVAGTATGIATPFAVGLATYFWAKHMKLKSKFTPEALTKKLEEIKKRFQGGKSSRDCLSEDEKKWLNGESDTSFSELADFIDTIKEEYIEIPEGDGGACRHRVSDVFLAAGFTIVHTLNVHSESEAGAEAEAGAGAASASASSLGAVEIDTDVAKRLCLDMLVNFYRTHRAVETLAAEVAAGARADFTGTPREGDGDRTSPSLSLSPS